MKDPLQLWKNLKERYNHQKISNSPEAHYNWMHLGLQDFKTIQVNITFWCSELALNLYYAEKIKKKLTRIC